MSRRAIAVVAMCVLITSPACSRRIRVTPFALDGHPSAVTVVGDHVWVSDDTGHSIHMLDARTGKAAGPAIDVPRNPIALAAGGGSVWVAHADGHVSAVDVRTQDVRERKLGGSLTGIAYALGRVWATDHEHGDLVEVDPDTLKAVDRVRVPDGAVRVAAGPARALWVTNNEDTVTRVVDGRVADVHKVGPGPIGLASDGRTVWVANSDDDTITVFRGANDEAPESVSVGDAPVAVAVVGGDAWSVDQDAGTLTALARGTRAPIELDTQPRGAIGVEWFGHREVWVVGSNPDAVVRVQL